MYLDTSVAIAIYTREPDSDKLETLLRRGDGFISSELLIGEMSRALLAKEKSRVITPALRKIIVKKLDDHLAAGLVHLVALNSFEHLCRTFTRQSLALLLLKLTSALERICASALESKVLAIKGQQVFRTGVNCVTQFCYFINSLRVINSKNFGCSRAGNSK